MITIILGFVVCVILIGMGVLVYEAKHSIPVDPNLPFLHDDYDDRNDPTLRYQRVFCSNCKFFDGGSICLNGTPAEVGDDRVEHCKKNSMFTPN